MDIVDKVLSERPELKPFYDNDIKDFYDENGDPELEINLGTKLGVLSRAFTDILDSEPHEISYIKVVLDMLEEFAQKGTEYDLGALEVMFFESLIWWAEDKESEPAEKYGDYFLSCIGPKCRELFQRNKEFWDELNKKLNKEREEEYRQMEEEYKGRKILEKGYFESEWIDRLDQYQIRCTYDEE